MSAQAFELEQHEHGALCGGQLGEPTTQQLRLLLELTTLALTCERTRVVSFMFSLPAAHVYYRHLTGMNDDFHDTICHTDAGDKSNQPRVDTGVQYTMRCLAEFLTKLKNTAHGASTLLDATLVYVTSDTAWGKVHDRTEWPVLLAGKAGGRLRGDEQHNKKRPARVERGRPWPTELAFALRFVGRSRCAAAQVAGLWGSWRCRWGGAGRLAAYSDASGWLAHQDLAVRRPPEGNEGSLGGAHGTGRQAAGTRHRYDRESVVGCLRVGHAATSGGARALVG